MRPSIAHLSAGLAAALFLAGCEKDEEPVYEGPVAEAGTAAALLLGATATLDGTASTVCCGLELAYTWSFRQVPIDSTLDDAAFGVTNSTPQGEFATFVPDVVGDFVVTLTVTDGVTTSAEDIVVVTSYLDNLPPVADAGDDVYGMEDTLLCADGSASYDPEGAALDFTWTVASAPTGSTIDSTDVYEGNTSGACIVPDLPGSYVLGLVVSDGAAYSEPDYMTVHASGDEDTPPVADAGASTTLPPCTESTFELNGFGSYDPQGSDLTYMWSLLSAPDGSTATDASFDDATKPNPMFTWDVSGDYSFTLQVSDGTNVSAPDVVTFTVTDTSENREPISNAGQDQTVEIETDCTTLDYVWTCDACDAVSFEVDGSGSSDPDGDELEYMWTDLTGGVSLDMPDAAWTRVETPAFAGAFDTTTTNIYELQLTVADCSFENNDTIALSVACTGEAAF